MLTLKTEALLVLLYIYILLFHIEEKDISSMVITTVMVILIIKEYQKNKNIIEGITNSEEENSEDSENCPELTTQEECNADNQCEWGNNVCLEKEEPEQITVSEKKAADKEFNINIKNNIRSSNQLDVDIHREQTRVGSYDGLCLNSIKESKDYKLVDDKNLNTYLGVQGPVIQKKTDSNELTGPSIDGKKNSPQKMTMFENNKTSFECCSDSPYYTSTGCLCLSENQKKFIQSRGFNNNYNNYDM